MSRNTIPIAFLAVYDVLVVVWIIAKGTLELVGLAVTAENLTRPGSTERSFVDLLVLCPWWALSLMLVIGALLSTLALGLTRASIPGEPATRLGKAAMRLSLDIGDFVAASGGSGPQSGAANDSQTVRLIVTRFEKKFRKRIARFRSECMANGVRLGHFEDLEFPFNPAMMIELAKQIGAMIKYANL